MKQRSIPPYERFGEPSPVTATRLRPHLFVAGETVHGLAHRYFEDWRQWRLIADWNGIRDARRIAPGTVLMIPAAPLQTGRFESA
jgi:nucleoid-associated protein YgaU